MTFHAPTCAGNQLRQTLHVRVASETHTFSLLIGPNGILRYDATLFSALSSNKRHFRCSDKLVVVVN